MSIGEIDKKLRDQGIANSLRYNELSTTIEYKRVALGEHACEKLQIGFSKNGLAVIKQNIIDVLAVMAKENPYDPVKNYLTQVENDSNVEAVDIDRLSTTYLGTDCELSNKILKMAVVAAVKRRFEPGCQYDYVVVTKGEQGIGKSTFFETIASPSYYTSSMAEQERDLITNIHSVWFYEFAELESVTSSRSIGKMKNLISTRVDLYRPAYGRVKECRPRRSILVGTVNSDIFLNDPTGARRYAVIEAPGRIDNSKVLADRDKIWKAAMIAYRSGAEARLSEADELACKIRNKAYEAEDPWLAMLENWFNDNPTLEQFTTHQALTGAGCCNPASIPRKMEMRVAELLKQLGWTRDKNQSGTSRARFWRRLPQPVCPAG